MQLLHFTKEALPDSISTDIQNLNKFNQQGHCSTALDPAANSMTSLLESLVGQHPKIHALQFECLTDIIFHFLTEPKETDRCLTQLSEFASENGMSPGPLKNLTKSILLVLSGALKRGLKADQVKTDLLTLGLNEDKTSHFENQWKVHSCTLSKLAVGHTLMVNQLVDMEWKFGVTAGSSELQKVGSIFLQLKLVVRKGNKTENVYMELTLPQFYNFLHEMERAKASLDRFN